MAHGPRRWRDLVSRHNEVVERVVDTHDGRLVKTTGDGVIALFDSAERAVRAAAARMMAVGQPGDIVVSGTVRDMLDGTDVVLEEFGVHELRGLHGQRQLYRLSRTRSGRAHPPAAAH